MFGLFWSGSVDFFASWLIQRSAVAYPPSFSPAAPVGSDSPGLMFNSQIPPIMTRVLTFSESDQNLDFFRKHFPRNFSEADQHFWLSNAKKFTTPPLFFFRAPNCAKSLFALSVFFPAKSLGFDQRPLKNLHTQTPIFLVSRLSSIFSIKILFSHFVSRVFTICFFCRSGFPCDQISRRPLAFASQRNVWSSWHNEYREIQQV